MGLGKQLLMSSSYWTLNKSVVEVLGIEAAFLITNMTESEELLSDPDGWFYQTIETLETITGLSRHKQEKAISTMIELDILLQKNKGIPMKRYFKINYEKIEELIQYHVATKNAKNSQTSMLEISNLECEKFTTSKELNNKELKNKEINTFSSDSIEYRLSEKLFELMKVNNPKCKSPNIQSWCGHIEKMIRIDKRSIEDIQKVIEWSQQDSFWKQNILSTSKLREKFDQLYLKANEKSFNSKNQNIREVVKDF